MTIRTTRPSVLLAFSLLTAVATSVPMLLTIQAVHAQGGDALPRSSDEFEKQIGLTAEQKAKLTAINQKYALKMQPITAKYKPSYEALQKKAQAEEAALQAKYQPQFAAIKQKFDAESTPIRLAQQKEADAVLTPTQREKIKKITAALNAQRAQAMKAGPGMPPAPVRK